jgi:hypothetical protein
MTKAVILGGNAGSGVIIASGLISEFLPPGLTSPTKAMTEATDQIVMANREVDDDQSPDLHFDAEKFDGGMNRIHAMADTLIDALKADDFKSARKALGGALHTLQDFYSHTHWVELGFNTPALTLIPPFDTPWPRPFAVENEETCDDSIPAHLVTTNLTSGYYVPAFSLKTFFFFELPPPLR